MKPARLILLACACACGPVVGASDEAGDGDSDTGRDPTHPSTSIATTGDATSPTTTIDPTTATTSTGTTSTSTSTSTTETTTECDSSSCDCCNFICPDWCWDVGGEFLGCDLYQQDDCRRGTKCLPWANDGSGIWNATRCSPIADAPGQIGDPCTVEGSGVSGHDDCDIGLMCLWVDASTNTGTCVQLCSGSEADPSCADPNTRCTIESEGELPLCLPICDPLLQNCPAGGGCFVGTGDVFVCGDAIEPTIGLEAPCDFPWTCAPGSLCVAADLLPGCGGAGCCTAYCDTTLPEPCGPERVCTPVFEGSIAGYCTAP